jgi:peptidyl-prolyl cis-trans isomerase B (cyclophilin B)
MVVKTCLMVAMCALASLSAFAQEPIEPGLFTTPFTLEEMLEKQVVFETDHGVIAIDLRPELAPNHVGLVMTSVADGVFDGTTFHRMVQRGIVQGGDPFTKDPGRTSDYGRGGLGLVEAEFSDASHVRGAVSSVLVPGDLSSGGSQFLICVVAQSALDGYHSIWGQVVDGMDVVTRISETPIDADGLATDRVTIRSARIRDKPPPEIPPFTVESDEELAAFRAVLTTTLGRIVVEFYPDVAPNHVRNFLRLVETGVYNGISFHRVVPGFVVQAGHLPTRREPLTDRQQRFIRNLEPEFNETAHVRGIVSMARLDDPASASTSFFICTDVAEELDGVYTAFGVVVEGVDVVAAIEETPTNGETPIDRIEIITAEVVRR